MDFLNEAVGQTKETISCSEWKSYQRYLVLKDCDFDLAKVSVVVPIYRVEQYLEQCVNSLLHQTLTDLEILLVNDASPDRSLEIAYIVKPEIIGGLIIRLDNRVVDSSLKTQIDTLSRQLSKIQLS